MSALSEARRGLPLPHHFSPNGRRSSSNVHTRDSVPGLHCGCGLTIQGGSWSDSSAYSFCIVTCPADARASPSTTCWHCSRTTDTGVPNPRSKHMAAHFCVTVRFLQPVFHGRGLDDEPEWPPSPLRIFQSLVAASSWQQPAGTQDRMHAFECLECIEQAPTLIAPSPVIGDGYRLSVPNNAMDKVAAAWSCGNYFGSADASSSGHRTFKRVRPIHLPENAAIHCVWSLAVWILKTNLHSSTNWRARHGN